MKSILSSSIWGIIAKILDAFAKFVTIPLLVGYYGKSDYGLIALAFSLNAYLRLMDLGLNVGSIRFFSMWIAEGNIERLRQASRSSMIFYGVIGLLNASVFIWMSYYPTYLFSIESQQIPIFQNILYVLAASSIFNWTLNVVTQLLVAQGQIGLVNRISIIPSILIFLTAIISVKFDLPLSEYFIYYTLSTLSVIPISLYRLKIIHSSLSQLLKPAWNSGVFREIFVYSSSLFMIGIFQLSADSLRPLLLSKFTQNGTSVLTDYRIIQTISALVVAFGSVFSQIILPSATRAYFNDDKSKLNTMVYDGTKYISIFLCFVVFNIITSADLILSVYMGESFKSLSPWLIIWLITILLTLHKSPIDGLILSSGKTKFLLYTSAVSCVVSLPVTVILAPKYEIGAAVIGYAIYMLIQISCYYFFYIPIVLKLDSTRIFFKSFLSTVLIGVSASFAGLFIDKYFVLDSDLKHILLLSTIVSAVYTLLTYIFVITRGDIQRFKLVFKSNVVNK